MSVCVGGINPYSVWLRRAHRLAVRSAIMAGSCGVACMRTVAQADTHLRTRGLSLPLTFTHVWSNTEAHCEKHTFTYLLLFYFIGWEAHFLIQSLESLFSFYILEVLSTVPVMQRQTQKVQKYLDYRCTRPLKWTMHDKLSVYHATKVWCFINKELMNWYIFNSRHNSAFCNTLLLSSNQH